MDKLDVWVFRHALSCNNLADKKGKRVDFIKHLKKPPHISMAGLWTAILQGFITAGKIEKEKSESGDMLHKRTIFVSKLMRTWETACCLWYGSYLYETMKKTIQPERFEDKVGRLKKLAKELQEGKTNGLDVGIKEFTYSHTAASSEGASVTADAVPERGAGVVPIPVLHIIPYVHEKTILEKKKKEGGMMSSLLKFREKTSPARVASNVGEKVDTGNIYKESSFLDFKNWFKFIFVKKTGLEGSLPPGFRVYRDDDKYMDLEEFEEGYQTFAKNVKQIIDKNDGYKGGNRTLQEGLNFINQKNKGACLLVSHSNTMCDFFTEMVQQVKKGGSSKKKKKYKRRTNKKSKRNRKTKRNKRTERNRKTKRNKRTYKIKGGNDKLDKRLTTLLNVEEGGIEDVPALSARKIVRLPGEQGVLLLDPGKFEKNKVKVLQNLWGLWLKNGRLEVHAGFNIEDKNFDSVYYDRTKSSPCHINKFARSIKGTGIAKELVMDSDPK